MSRRLLLNLAPVRIDDAEIRVGSIGFESDDQMRRLRREHYATHVFRRSKNEIQCIAKKAGVPDIGDRFEQVRLHRATRIAAALLREALIDFLSGMGRRVEAFSPISFTADPAQDNLLRDLPGSPAVPPWLSIVSAYDLDVRSVRTDKREPFVAVALNVRARRRITATCADLAQAGVTLTGHYIGTHEAHEDPRIAPRFKLLGKVESAAGDTLYLTDTRDELDRITTAEAYVECKREAFDACVKATLGRGALAVQKEAAQRISHLSSGPGRLDKLKRVMRFLGSRDLEIAPGVNARIGSFIEQGGSDRFPNVRECPKTMFVFDASGNRTSRWNDGGLTQHGPYSADTFTPSKPRVCIICEASEKGHVEQVLHKFLHGINGGGKPGSRPVFAGGFIRKYGLDDAETVFFTTDAPTADAYQRAARIALERQQDSGRRWDLALVQIRESFHGLRGDANPYLVCKAAFLSQQISVQEFEIETVTANDWQLSYVLNSMALATYAKLGGVPWLLKADGVIAHELVVGMGSAFVGASRLGKRERVVGITTVFSGDGNYHVANLTKAVSIDDYKETLLGSLRSSIAKAQRQMNWQPREHVRLIFHAFKPLKDAEVEAVKALMAGMGDYDAEFAFLHIVEDHPYLIFDNAQQGVAGGYRATGLKGVLAPTRGVYLNLSDDEVLLSLTGANEVKKPEDGMPWPVLLRLHRGSTFTDMSYLTKQVFAFACHSWRSFNASPLPVTILCSDLVANLLGQLAAMPKWNPESMFGRIGETRWFL